MALRAEENRLRSIRLTGCRSIKVSLYQATAHLCAVWRTRNSCSPHYFALTSQPEPVWRASARTRAPLYSWFNQYGFSKSLLRTISRQLFPQTQRMFAAQWVRCLSECLFSSMFAERFSYLVNNFHATAGSLPQLPVVLYWFVIFPWFAGNLWKNKFSKHNVRKGICTSKSGETVGYT